MILADAIISALKSTPWLYGDKPAYISVAPGEFNVVYVEGMNLDGSPNDNAPNCWNDVRLLLGSDSQGRPYIAGKWLATSEPGKFFTLNPLNPLGAARIKFGQYKAWRVGMHGTGANAHEALVQCGSIVVYRDINKDYKRTGDPQQVGSTFGINQHHGYNMQFVDKASAGCLVGQSNDGHQEFMTLLKSDLRYLAGPGFAFHTAVIPYSAVQPFLAPDKEPQRT